ncbi:TDP-N-acetylfucosamine:lipid II N-acetylfucosaminyltransferase [Myroides odoratimimus]|uniref:TDP-N-acetylfucosamine:lipid II N-acetylfucosaminyltransferase n=1 Tax=Myroides odoratimimus TaxID=76832 RepID=UPI002574E071|nr:TDP-N-acetylfucosamine:lipid II N-acetylfucosaminyltransferase [Myroides odoratimimus]MDM1444012.1 TDP-N-acetylfucosamine:lipid II N-acetylfucosaminyltransferase [Myroides odoratimimus]
MRILHIIDDVKFIESCRQLFNVDNVDNYYLKKGEVSDSYLTNNRIDIVCIHYLDNSDVEFILNCQVNVKYVWFFWGGDGFCLGKYYNRFLQLKTNLFRVRCEFKKSNKLGVQNLIKTLFPWVIDYQQGYKNKLKAIKKIDIIVPVMPGDYKILSSDYGLKMPFLHLNYITPYFFNNSRKESPSFSNGKDILLGNSASYTNNHFEIIDVLTKVEGEENIYIPLNYGDDILGKKVKNYAVKNLGEKAKVLREFLSFDEYTKVYDTCGVIILNHIRQQGVGNIIMALVLGKTLYLRDDSTVYKFLKEKGFIFKNIKDINTKGITYILESDKLVNYDLCYEVFGKDIAKKKIIELINYLE